MILKVTAKYVIEQDTGLVVDEASNNLPTKSVMLCKMTPFIITEEGDIDHFKDGKMETVYQVDNQSLEFFEGQVRELQVEKNQGFITSDLWALMGSRHKTRRRQVTGIQPMPVTSGSATPVTTLDSQATTTSPTQLRQPR